ncbi:2-phospho-L-lactate transferase [Methanobacterium alcaliphilum]|uniref:2-phospho-L-lactate transferase n=1 Tax=Methanobacterium alcaliphilum TaxID=392018 RepID=UPI00200AB2B9|nr:2-phospho-L-lactate transferase [Methanobacterium alcaliphilum]MCK9150380.1 2-phospho-L-lactate transferase [Methanobacterium alcaliphilum]
MITILSGGTGTPKLIQGIKEIIDESNLNIIVNTLENDYFSGVYVTPDIDTVLYTLSDLINLETWYGIKDDTFITHEKLKELGCPELLRIGDKDRALKIQKTILLKNYPLSQVVDIQRKQMDIKARIIPMSNQQSTIKIMTPKGEMSFHQFLIKEQGKVPVDDVVYNEVEPAPDMLNIIENSETVVIGPSNPITSIGPIISIKGVEKALKKVHVVGVSPIIGNSPVSGPAAKFMQACGHEVSALGVCDMYSKFLDRFIIDSVDSDLETKIEKLIKDVTITNTKMRNIGDKVMLARTVLGEIV